MHHIMHSMGLVHEQQSWQSWRYLDFKWELAGPWLRQNVWRVRCHSCHRHEKEYT